MALTIAAAVAAAAAVAQTANSMAANQRAAKLNNKALQQQYKANADQQLQLRMQGVLAEQNHSIVASQLGDQAVQNGLNRAQIEVQSRAQAQKMGHLATAADRLRSDAADVGWQADLARRGLDIKQGQAVAAAVDAGAQTMAKAAKDLGAVRALAGEAGLAGSSMTAFAREIAHVEGTNLASAARQTRDALEGIDTERTGTVLRAVSALNDLGRRSDSLVAEEQSTKADQSKLQMTNVSALIADRQLERDALRNDINLDGSRVGIGAQASQLESAAQVAGIQGQLQALQMNTNNLNSIFQMIGSGASLYGGYESGRQKLDAQKAYYNRVATIATNRS